MTRAGVGSHSWACPVVAAKAVAAAVTAEAVMATEGSPEDSVAAAVRLEVAVPRVRAGRR